MWFVYRERWLNKLYGEIYFVLAPNETLRISFHHFFDLRQISWYKKSNFVTKVQWITKRKRVRKMLEKSTWRYIFLLSREIDFFNRNSFMIYEILWVWNILGKFLSQSWIWNAQRIFNTTDSKLENCWGIKQVMKHKDGQVCWRIFNEWDVFGSWVGFVGWKFLLLSTFWGVRGSIKLINTLCDMHNSFVECGLVMPTILPQSLLLRAFACREMMKDYSVWSCCYFPCVFWQSALSV